MAHHTGRGSAAATAAQCRSNGNMIINIGGYKAAVPSTSTVTLA